MTLLPHFLCERRVDALVKDAQYGFATLIWTDSRGTVHRCLGASHFLAFLDLFFESQPSKPRRNSSIRSPGFSVSFTRPSKPTLLSAFDSSSFSAPFSQSFAKPLSNQCPTRRHAAADRLSAARACQQKVREVGTCFAFWRVSQNSQRCDLRLCNAKWLATCRKRFEVPTSRTFCTALLAVVLPFG